MRKKKPKLVKLHWYDAKGFTGVQKEIFLGSNLIELCPVCETYGYILIENEDAIVIVTEDSSDGVDATIVPKKWLIRIEDIK